jgi:hypothetical protein
MQGQSVFAIGSDVEIAHHVAPFADDVSLRIVSPEHAIATARPGDLAIFYSEHFDRFRHCCVELKKRNVATLYLVDGILEWRNSFENRPTEPACPWTMRTVLSHKVACIGASQQRILDAWGNQGKTELVGIPRLENLCRLFAEGQLIRPRASNNFRVLIATAKTPGFTDEQVAVTKKSLSQLQAFFSKTRFTNDGREIEILWRLSGGLAEQLDVPNHAQDFAGTEAMEQLRSVDAVITTPSTLMLESMLLNRPTAILNFHNCPSFVSAAWQIQHADQFASVVEELADPPGAKLELQKLLLGDALYCGSNSIQRMVELIDGMKCEAREALATNRPFSFAQAILPTPIAALQTFATETLFPQVAELGFDSPRQLAAELVQSRREISHLQRELAQAKAELAQAHGIFEEIRNHPIAGPIVRIRESLLSFLKRPKQSNTAVEKSVPAVETASELPTLTP